MASRVHEVNEREARLLAKLVAQLHIPVDDLRHGRVPGVLAALTARLREPQRLHGLRTEVLFKALVASLGHCRLVKDEDAGSCTSLAGEVAVPDFRLVLRNGENLLVEVKSHFDALAPFTVDLEYLTSLERYAALSRMELRFAVNWAGGRMWTLLAPAVLRNHVRDGKARLTVEEALPDSEMALLGDRMITLHAPVRWRVVGEPRLVTGTMQEGTMQFRIVRTALMCGDEELTDEKDRNLAAALMFFNGWPSQGWRMVQLADGRAAMDLVLEPPEGGEFPAVVGHLSDMYSRYFNTTVPVDGVDRPDESLFAPGGFGQLVPQDWDFRAARMRISLGALQPRWYEAGEPPLARGLLDLAAV